MRVTSFRLNYDNPGSYEQRQQYLTNLSLKSKQELLLILKNVAMCCDSSGKGYVNQWEDSIRNAIGYK
jgi:hypothetical protein